VEEIALRDQDSLISHYMGMGRYQQAINLIYESLAVNPEEGYLHYRLGLCHYYLDQLEEAELQLANALSFGFDREIIMEVQGHLCVEAGRWQEAEEAYLEVLRENPNDASVHAAYAYLMMKTGHQKKADQLLAAALRLDPDNAQALRYRFMFADKTREEKVEVLERYMHSTDSDTAKLIQLGLDCLYTNRYSRAREHFRQAYLLDPTNQNLLEVMKSFDRDFHPLLAPLRVVGLIGGPGVMWVIGIGSIMGTRAMGWDKASLIVGGIYLLFVIYSWSALGIVSLVDKFRR